MKGLLTTLLSLILQLGCGSEGSLGPTQVDDGADDDIEEVVRPSPHRTWGAPKLIEAVPIVESPIGAMPVALGRVGPDVYLMINIPQDTVLPHIDNRLGVLVYNGSEWEMITHLNGSGRHWPAAIVEGIEGVHLFWAGHTDKEMDSFVQHGIRPHLFHCLLTGEVCRNTTSVTVDLEGSSLTYLFGTPVVDASGNVHVTPFSGLQSRHLVYGPDGRLLAENPLPLDRYPNVAIDGAEPILALEGGRLPAESNKINWIQYRKFDGTSWGGWTPVYSPQEKWDPVYSRMAVDSKGGYHIISFLWHDSGRIRLVHLSSFDEGRRWHEPERLFETPYFFQDGPQVIIDSRDDIHVTWIHPGPRLGGRLRAFDAFFVSRVGGVWTEVQSPFAKPVPTSITYVADDSQDQLHAVWTHGNKMYHSIMR